MSFGKQKARTRFSETVERKQIGSTVRNLKLTNPSVLNRVLYPNINWLTMKKFVPMKVSKSKSLCSAKNAF